MGLPNSGKTTYSMQYENVIHLDDYSKSKFKKCNEVVKNTDGNVVVEGIYNSEIRRKELLDVVKDKKCRNVCIWLDTSTEECLRRENLYRCRGDHIVKKNARLFDEPTLSEGWDEIMIIRGDDVEVVRKDDVK